MKKIILLAGLLFCGIIQAQGISFTTTGGAEITEGEVFTFTTLDLTSKMPLWVENNSAETIHFKIRVDEITNNTFGDTAEELQLCFQPLCYNTIVEGNTYPNNEVTLAPGASNNIDDHFFNTNAGDGVNPVIYRFTFIKVDQDENFIANLRSFTYKYAPTLGAGGIASLENVGITVSNTVVKDMLSVNARQNANLEVYSVTGQLLQTAVIKEGAQSVDISGLSSAIYIAKFTNSSNQTSSIRIVKN